LVTLRHEFISDVVDFLKDVGWIKQNLDGSYQVTKKGQTGTIKRERPTIYFRITPNYTNGSWK
jgi:predicted transcriptional regulator